MKSISLKELREIDSEQEEQEDELREEEEDKEEETVEIDDSDEPKASGAKSRNPGLTKEQEAEMFKLLAHKSYKDVGYTFGLQHVFESDVQMRSWMMNVFRKIRKAPELWGISTDLVEVVDEAAASRSIKNNPRLQSDIQLEQESFRDKLDQLRDTAAEILKKKLDKAIKAKGGIDGLSIRDLKDLLAMTIDKSRLMRGESTENITKISKIDTESLTPEDALKVIMKARDMLVEGKK